MSHSAPHIARSNRAHLLPQYAKQAPALRQLARIALMAILLGACSHATPARFPGYGDQPPLSAPAHLTPREKALYTYAVKWTGVPYRWGGTDRNGVDCSGLAVRIYKDFFGVQLPRTTRSQIHSGRKASRRHLIAGDLLFFRVSGNQRHVGIYLFDHYFLHASKSRDQVIISSLNRAYWQKTFRTARRILSPDL
jgi:cell wall-associated NlpC family hydrolase